MGQPPNIVWFLIDSIRTYPTDQDLRGKLPIMERFAQQGVEFTTCVTTAPSTIMSVTAMMTGLPAYFLARNYDDFQFDRMSYRSLADVLKQHGYASYAFLRGPETREKFRYLLDPVARKYWPPHLRHGFKWTNKDLNLVLERVLQAGIPRPAFLFFHYNPQTRSKGKILADPAISDRIEAAWSELEQAGFTSDNTIYIMCSDHGFPDPSTGLSTEWEIKHRLTHDLVLTDDNILIPLSIRYPGCRPKQVAALVSSMDIFPTVLDLAGISDTEEIKSVIDGTTLVPLMDSGDAAAYPRRFSRCDSRLMFQTGRSTVIRGRNFKYIRHHDNYQLLADQASSSAEVLVDLERDPLETTNLLLTENIPSHVKEALSACKAEFRRTETKAVEYQINYLLARNHDTFSGKNGRGSAGQAGRALLIFEPHTAAYVEIGLSAIANVYPLAKVDVLAGSNNISDRLARMARKIFDYEERADGKLSSPSFEHDGNSQPYDLAILFVQNPAAPIVDDLLQMARLARARRHLVLDCNFNVYRHRRYWYYRFRALVRRLPYALEEPMFVILQLKVGGKILAQHMLRRMGLWERWEDVRRQEGPIGKISIQDRQSKTRGSSDAPKST